MRLTGVALALLAAAALAARPARADTCGPVPGLELVLPVDGSTGVSRAAQIVVRHELDDAPTDDAPSVTITEEGRGEVTGVSTWDGRQMTFHPDAPLGRARRYTVVAERPGRSPHTFSFETGLDEALPMAPVLGPDLEVSARYLGGGPEGDDPCGPTGFERYRIHLELPAARGSSGAANILYLVFQTEGRGIEGPTEVTRAVDETASDVVDVDLYRPADGVNGRACFRVLALDVSGAASGTTTEACVQLEEGPFFASCSAARPMRSMAACWWFAAALTGAAALRQRALQR